MSVDTRDKRASAVALGLVGLLVGPTPDGSLATAADRLHVAGLYRGPLSAAVATPLGPPADFAPSRVTDFVPHVGLEFEPIARSVELVPRSA